MRTFFSLLLYLILFFASSCEKDFEKKVAGTYQVTVSANSQYLNQSWDTTYGTCLIKIEVAGSKSLRFIDNSILNRQFELEYNKDASSQDNFIYYGIPVGPQYIKLNRTNDDIVVGDDVFVHTSGSYGTYWIGTKVQ